MRPRTPPHVSPSSSSHTRTKTPAARPPRLPTPSAPSTTQLPDTNAARFEESLHFVRLQRIKHPLDLRPIPTNSATELAYPRPPTPPDSDPGSDDSSHASSSSFHSANDYIALTTAPTCASAPIARLGIHELDDAATVTTTTNTASSRTSSKRARAKMAASVVSKPIKKSYVGMVAGLASTIGLGQAMFLKATYQSPPDARGPRSGVERPPRRLETLSSAEGHVARILPTANAASAVADDKISDAVQSVVEGVRAQLNLNLEPITHIHDGRPVTKKKRILIIGDSLVSGVGGESSFEDGPRDGPALPRQVARYLSEMLNVDVQWNAMSLTGGDVRMLKRKIIPMLTRERTRGTIGDISAVVLVTGVNDWKRISPLRTASKFRQDLAEFINKIRQQVGHDCPVFLPAIPGVHHTPRFHEPLRSIVVFLNDYWDSQKVQLSRTMRRVFFVGQPPSHEWGTNPVQFFSTLDRVHPSELGYKRWAERIAEHMVGAFRKGVKAASGVTQRATAVAVEQAADVADSATKDISRASAVAAAAGKTNMKVP
ncbi:hypothetical protein BWQ96_00855 [Gracilariopsis chorda]|uniref:SGNH hydrolase-type esterase domain-containing protein n=1 Tax=Gracilariopsis chorda TaxID=448386 RepID=A0A2V3J4A2_9FLOR|nr:hypothetical protein BWQ96_00855 [Gracilariopsis chorda]|eukprot:PXF49281.1 hypothetical protein BWQ96_00855 [Gracilariopsis chorda]